MYEYKGMIIIRMFIVKHRIVHIPTVQLRCQCNFVINVPIPIRVFPDILLSDFIFATILLQLI